MPIVGKHGVDLPVVRNGIDPEFTRLPGRPYDWPLATVLTGIYGPPNSVTVG